METLISNKIYIKYPSQKIIDFCYDELIVNNPDYVTMIRLGKENIAQIKHIPAKLNLFTINGNQVILPFGCLRRIWGLISAYNYETKFNENEPISCRFDKITQPLYDYQEVAVEAMLNAKGGVLVGGCGSGKTNVGVELVKRIGKRFLWLTHTLDLARQTRDRFKKLYPNMKIGLTSDGKVDFGHDGTIATVQTMVKLDRDIYEKEFDLVIVDECHKCVGSPTLAKMFSKVVGTIPARYKYGLTATPKRNDSLTQTIYTTLGANLDGEFAPVYTIDRSKTKTLTAEHRRIDTDVPFSYSMLNDDGTFNFGGLVDYLSTNTERNELIVNNVAKLQQEGRKQIILCSRVEHAETLVEMLNAKSVKAVLLVGEVSEKKREKILSGETEWDVIVGTISLAKEGLDVPQLDTLHLVSIINNKSDTVQCVGRIERVCEGKKDPIVFDYVDKNIPYTISRYKNRAGWLKKRD